MLQLSSGPVAVVIAGVLLVSSLVDPDLAGPGLLAISVLVLAVGVSLTGILVRLLRETTVTSLRVDGSALVLTRGSRSLSLAPGDVVVVHPVADIFHPLPSWYRWGLPRFSGTRVVTRRRLLGGTLSYVCAGCALTQALEDELRAAGYEVDALRSWS